MDLLPKTVEELSSKHYWNTFFAKRGAKAFEWYGEYTELCGILHKYMKTSDIILVAGCGNSTISADLYKVGYRSIVNVDISETVIKQMKEKYKDFTGMTWVQNDLLSLAFGEGEFSCVLDKGTLDAFMTHDSSEVRETTNKYFDEIGRILRVGGRYICISLLQEHILMHLLQYFPSEGWMVRICRCEDAEESQKDGKFSFPVFVIVCTKFKAVPNFKPILEVSLHGEKIERIGDVQKVADYVRELQQYALIRHNLQLRGVTGEDVRVELCDTKSGKPRYFLIVVEAPRKTSTYPFAVFIVPHGRENEWMFGTAKGRAHLAESAGASRLVVVHLQRDQTYKDLPTIQEELSEKIMELAPSKLSSHQKVPFLSVGENINSLKEVENGNSPFSGDYVIEDVDCGERGKFRRLIFLSNQNVIQSEAKLITGENRSYLEVRNNSSLAKERQVKRNPYSLLTLDVHEKRKKKGGIKEYVKVDHSYLSCEHHLRMVLGLATAPKDSSLLIIGLGGGPLATYIHKNFLKVKIKAVEIDATMVRVAQEWFGFSPDQRMTVEVGDGLDYIEGAAISGEKYQVIMFDVDSKESSVGMSCPPRDFVQHHFLDKVATCLQDQGIFILNLVCRDDQLKSAVISDVKSVFPNIICQKIPEELNTVLLCYKNPQPDSQALLKIYEKSIEDFNVTLQKRKTSERDLVDVREILKDAAAL